MSYHESLAALADPTRRQIFEALAAGPSPVGALAARVPVSRPAVSQHLKVLSDAGLVVCRAEGTRRLYAIRPDGLAELRAWLEAFWDDALRGYAAAADEINRKEGPDV